MKGLIHIYTGDGKGKTTAAVGLGIRAYGRGLKVLMAQFLKGRKTGETEVLRQLGPNFKLIRSGISGRFCWQMDEDGKDEVKKLQQKLFDDAIKEAFLGKWDMLILDEILGTVKAGFVNAGLVKKMLKEKPDELEVVLTGRDSPGILITAADYVSEIRKVKHPADKGVNARRGIEL